MKCAITIAAALCVALIAGCGEAPAPTALQAPAGTAAPLIGHTVTDRELDAYHNGEMKKIRLSRYRGKWLILFFYPADFTFVCPTELKDMSEHYEKFRKAGAEVVSVSTDSVFVHQAWAGQHEDIKKIRYPMASDRPGTLSRALGIYDAAKGVSVRASFIVDPEGKIVAVEMTDEAIGRSAAELLRKLEAAVAVRESDGGFCPANWHAGEEMITPK
ncbi:MAG TPA: peroxiredoxin [Spirochaetota bacterium]|nr:peroxiredoxin [Spirochaetota bacterium]